MKIPPDGARWLVMLRWWAAAHVFLATWLASQVLGIVDRPIPLYLVGCALVVYNTWFYRAAGRASGDKAALDRSVGQQLGLDIVSLAVLLYASDLPRNPFILYFVFHMIMAGISMRGRAPYVCAALTTALVGTLMLLQYIEWIPRFPIHFPNDPPEPQAIGAVRMVIVFVALASTLWLTVYLTTSIRRYVDRAHESLRQKEKMLGIGQLVAGIAHQIANPLDGMQNCLQTVGERVKDDAQLTEYVRMMAEALERIESTAKRVQAFARPRGIELQPTSVNAAVRDTLQVLGGGHRRDIEIETRLGEVPSVQGDPYTLQEILFNLVTNAMAAMPRGGTLTIGTSTRKEEDEEPSQRVAVTVADTGVGISPDLMDRIFEPFFTTRADSGGTGLGLGLCRMLISEMGGRIEVESRVGKGTTFTVILNSETDTGNPPGSKEG